jgi:hypothetical protein
MLWCRTERVALLADLRPDLPMSGKPQVGACRLLTDEERAGARHSEYLRALGSD